MLKILNTLLISASVFAMVACSPTATPNAANPDGTTTGNDSTASADITVGSVTKAQYIQLLECALAKSGASAEAKVSIENIKASVNAIPDAQWNVIAAANPAFSTQLQLAVQQGCSL